ncbi:hypothetical protein MWU60_08655 [Yoonia sp. F2084L]|uniref:hypothetical protein n=1 Tax=Yoonia sp. F2084L TaxID=2926419 RepID=UPI001FF128FF|nr:hypothetical protein [Yoonia sp. F2084L]MCK0095638.1 hypothetical protein [Yoonia sp. F2084L]
MLNIKSRLTTGYTAHMSVAGTIGILALTISTFLSGSGIYFSTAGTTLGQPERLAISGIATLFITSLAFIFWVKAGHAVHERRLRRSQRALPKPRATGWVFAGVLMTSMSLLTAITALLYMNNKDGVQAMMNNAAFSSTVGPVSVLSDGMTEIALTASQADALASNRSQVESAVGGTCGVSPAGAGPLTRMRAAHAEEAANIFRRATALSERARLISSNMIAAQSQARVEALFQDAVNLRLDPERLAIANAAEGLKRGYGTDGFLFEGRQRFCPDPVLATLFSEIETSARNVIELPSGAPVRRDVKIFDVFMLVLPVLMDGQQGREVGITRGTILPFVIFALLVDIVSLAGAWAHGAGNATRIKGSELEQIHKTAWILRNFVWEFPPLQDGSTSGKGTAGKSQAFVCVPLGGDPKRTHQAEYLTALFKLSVDAEHQFETLEPRRREFEPWVSQMRLAGGGATHYALYPVKSQATYDQLMQMKVDAISALGLAELDTEFLPEFGQGSNKNVVSLRAA